MMDMPALPMPLLRFRDGDLDGFFERPVTIVGTIAGTALDVVTVSLGRERFVQLYVEDFIGLLGTPEETLGFFVDAERHRDLVTIRLTSERLSYDNPAQSERVAPR